MLVIANGAFKSGSTWQYHLAAELLDWKVPPAQYLRRGWEAPSLAEWKFHRSVGELSRARATYLTKGHHFRRRCVRRLVTVPGVTILNIERDCVAVVVSAYNQFQQKHASPLSMERYFDLVGCLTIDAVRRHHAIWRQTGPSGAYFEMTYEDLRDDFAGQCQNLAYFLGVPLNDVDKIQRATSRQQLENLYRASGVAGMDARAFFGGKAKTLEDVSLDLETRIREIYRDGMTMGERTKRRALLRTIWRSCLLTR